MKVVFLFMVNLALVSSVLGAQKNCKTAGAERTLGRDPKEDCFFDDIKTTTTVQRSAISDAHFLWTHVVPYEIDPTIPLNTKAVIVRSIHDFMLKSCIKFKPREHEFSYLYFQQLEGCWSYIGQIYSKQTVSIGDGCEQPYIVKHELLHALGFYHEQSRMDRDQYVTINFNNVIESTKGNFQKVRAGASISNGVPYDYTSVMHYNAYGFSNNGLPTITTKNPDFQDQIGLYTEMSPADVLELNLLYECSHPLANSIHCTFEVDFPCEIKTCPHNALNVTVESEVEDGPQTDHTSLPIRLPGHEDPEPVTGSFVHFSTAYSQEGESGWIATPIMKPALDCKRQCLEFYYYHSGGEDDILNIWIREYEDNWDHKGTLRVVGQVTGPPTELWKIHHVSLNAVKNFRVEFQVRKGNGISIGGISIDDIHITENRCPALAVQVDNFLNETQVVSEVVYSTSGYGFVGGLNITDEFFIAFIALASGKNDAGLEWPVEDHRVIFTLLDQNPTHQDRMSFVNESPVDPDEEVDGDLVWGDPRKNTDRTIQSEDGQTIYLGHEYSISAATPILDRLHFYKGGSVVMLMDLEELALYNHTDSTPCPKSAPFHGQHVKEEDCFTKTLPVTRAPISMNTDDKSIFGFSPATVASPFLVLMAVMMLLMP